MTPFLNNSILIAISKHGGSCGGPFLLPLFLFFDYTARGILSSFTLMGKLYGGTYIFLSECVPLWREGICVMHQSWVWDDPKLGSSIVPETEMWRDTTVAVVLRWVRTSQGGSGLSTDFLVLWSGCCYVANYPYIFLINIQIYLRTKQDIISVSLETWWLLYSTKSQ